MDASFVGYPPLPWALEQISRLNDTQYEELRAAIFSPQGFSSNYARCKKIANGLEAGLSPREVFNLLNSLAFLYDRSREWESSQRDLDAAFQEFLEFSDLDKKLGEDPEGVPYQRLRQLVAKNPSVERHRKTQLLITGVLDLAVDFASFVDLRPRFSEDRTTVEEMVPVIVLQTVVEHDYGEPTSYVFQLTSGGFSKLRRVLDDVEKKLSALNTDETLSPRLYTFADDQKDGTS